MVRKLPVLLFLVFYTIAAFPQLLEKKVLDLQDYQYKKEASGGARLQTNGFSIFAEYGWIKDLKKTRLLQLEYTYYIDYHQKKQKSYYQGGKDYFFGLQNHLHTLRFSYGIKRTIADKADRSGVRLAFVAFGGFSLALLKPYYLNLVQADSNSVKPERYTTANATRFLDKNFIVEAAPTRYGLSEIELVPGVHGKFALDFDWGKKDEFVKAIEAGIMLDLYYKRLPIMINESNHFYQIALYMSFQFGKRW